MFLDSPIAYCPVANRYVLLDQTQECCAIEMECPPVDCPLARFFAAPPGAGRPEAGGGTTKNGKPAGSTRTPIP